MKIHPSLSNNFLYVLFIIIISGVAKTVWCMARTLDPPFPRVAKVLKWDGLARAKAEPKGVLTQ